MSPHIQLFKIVDNGEWSVLANDNGTDMSYIVAERLRRCKYFVRQLYPKDIE